MTAMPGTVYLVGAGPGDPGLLTRRGAGLLRAADVVLYDRLVSRALLRLVHPGAELVPVGKAPGRVTMPQEEIHVRLIAAARNGKVVVRLKGGDPFVFGRGSEERMACLHAEVPCVVVPGVSSAIAGPAAAGIPVTARGLSRSFEVWTGHAAGDDVADPVGHPGTTVVLMGRRALAAVVGTLQRRGYGPGTPAALIARATLPDERIVRGTLGTIAGDADREGIPGPAVLVAGAVAGVLPDAPFPALAGCRVLVTRPRGASRPIVELLRAEGAEVLVAPAIRITYLGNDAASLCRGSWDWIVFTSRHGVIGWWRGLHRDGLDARAAAGARIAAIGPATAAALRRVGLRADLVPRVHRAESLVGALAPHLGSGRRVLHPCGTRARLETRVGLERTGAEVLDLVVYTTEASAPAPALRRRVASGLDYLLLHSPSAVHSVVAHGLVPAGVVLVCLGQTTADAVRSHGLAPDIVAADHTDAGLVSALRTHALAVTR